MFPVFLIILEFNYSIDNNETSIWYIYIYIYYIWIVSTSKENELKGFLSTLYDVLLCKSPKSFWNNKKNVRGYRGIIPSMIYAPQ